MNLDALSAEIVLGLLVVGLAYIKIGVVLAVLQKGLSGGTGLPPYGLTAALALLFSALAMAPVAERSSTALAEARGRKAPQREVWAAGTEPLRAFLAEHTPGRERAAVLDLAQRVRRTDERKALLDRDLVVLLSAFALAQMREAFQIGFLLLLPFLLLDLLVASLLQGFSLPGISATTVALPFKLLLFVLCDGWHLLLRGLLLGYV